MGTLFNVFPLLLVPLLMYNLIVFGAGATGFESLALVNAKVFAIPLPATNLDVSVGDLLIIFSIGLVFVELLKSTSTGTAAILNHALAFLIVLVCVVEFLVHPSFGTISFLIILITSIMDVAAGIIVTIVSARRDVEFASGDP